MQDLAQVHECRCCGAPIPHELLACPQCWQLLPRELKGRIVTTHRKGPTEKYVEHVRAAEAIWKDTKFWVAKAAVVIAFLVLCGVAMAQDPRDRAFLPNKDLTPGAADPALTQKVLCSKTFRTGPYRNVPLSRKNLAYKLYGIKVHKTGQYEVDHLISLEIGGSNDIKNLWPQSYTSKPWNAHIKDVLENKLHALVCSGQITLKQAQDGIATDWIEAYYQFVGSPK
jgi:hypothetical protein